MIDELAYAGPEHLDAAFVAGFDHKQGYPDPAGDLDALAEQGLGADSTLVDLGTGTGQFALAAARRFGHVTAVDVSPAMLALLRERAADAGLGNLDCVRAGFLSYSHARPPADAVYTRHALHQLPDFWKALALDRIARMLRSGGILRLRDLIYDFQPAETEGVFRDWFRYAAAPVKAATIGQPRTPFHKLLLNAYYVDLIYDRLIVRPLYVLSVFLAYRVDLGIIDGLVNAVGRAVVAWAAGFRRLQTGYVVNYALTMLVGAVLLVGFLLIR